MNEAAEGSKNNVDWDGDKTPVNLRFTPPETNPSAEGNQEVVQAQPAAEEEGAQQSRKNLKELASLEELPVETAALAPPPDVDNPLFMLSQAAKAGEQTMVAAKRCVVGAIRDRNEDSCLVFTSETGGHFTLLPFGLYIVADGMGGHQNGHEASRTASRVAARYIIDRVYLPLLQVDKAPNPTPIQEVLENAVEAAHRALFDPTDEADSGTTLTIGLVLGNRLYVAHVGDTRLYLWYDGKLEKITTDHSLVQRLQDVGQLTAEEASLYQYRNVLLRAVGQGEDLVVDTYTRRLPRKGRILLCTDGLSGLVSESEINLILQQEKPADAIAGDLMDAAMDAGGYDNITAIVVDFQQK